MTSLVVFEKLLHNISLEDRGYLGLVRHLCCVHHGSQMRDDGTPYQFHVNDVMRQIIEIQRACDEHVDYKLVSAGGCHDLIEDSYGSKNPVTPAIIRKAFSEIDPVVGQVMAFRTEAVSKRPRTDFPNKKARLREYHIRLFEKARIDPLILLIKYADRLHNLATLHGLTVNDPDKVYRVASETRDFYVPMGRSEALKILPERYHIVFGRMVDRMYGLALAYLTDEFEISCSPKPLTESGSILLP